MGGMRQKYHLEPDRGLLNDPNGLAYFKGKYYVFFQWNRFAKDHGYKEWGLFKSSDLLNWTFEGSALLPDQIYDQDGVYSGSACVIEDKLCLFYTGNTKSDGRRKVYQCMAVSSDGRKYLKHGCVLETPADYTEHFRDPKVFKGSRQGYFMVIGAQKSNGKGAVALASSCDGVHWSVKGNLAETEMYEMVECPDLFELDGKHVLMFNPQERDNDNDVCGVCFSAYKIMEFDEKTETVGDRDLDKHCRFDQGFDFYAPQTFCDDKGRRIMFGWMSRMNEMQEQIFAAEERNIHCLTLPRELNVKNGRLYQRVPEEFERLKGKQIPLEMPKTKEIKAVFPQKAAFVKVSGSDLDQGISIRFPEDGTKIFYNGSEKVFTFVRYDWVNKTEEQKSFPMEMLYSLELWLDQSSIEIFLNEGEYVLSSRIYSKGEGQTVIFKGMTEKSEIECKEINTGGMHNE